MEKYKSQLQIKQWNDQTNLEQAEKFKQQANNYFKQKMYKDALKKYHQAILHLTGIIDKDSAVALYSKTASKQTSSLANSLKFSIWLNMSQIYIFQQKYDKGLEIIKKAESLLQNKLSQQIKNKALPKLFYRKGVCYMKLNYFTQCKEAFNQLKKIDQSFNQEIQNMEKQIKQRQKMADQKSKKIFEGFFK